MLLLVLCSGPTKRRARAKRWRIPQRTCSHYFHTIIVHSCDCMFCVNVANVTTPPPQKHMETVKTTHETMKLHSSTFFISSDFLVGKLNGTFSQSEKSNWLRLRWVNDTLKLRSHKFQCQCWKGRHLLSRESERTRETDGKYWFCTSLWWSSFHVWNPLKWMKNFKNLFNGITYRIISREILPNALAYASVVAQHSWFPSKFFARIRSISKHIEHVWKVC